MTTQDDSDSQRTLILGEVPPAEAAPNVPYLPNGEIDWSQLEEDLAAEDEEDFAAAGLLPRFFLLGDFLRPGLDFEEESSVSALASELEPLA